MIIKFLVKNFPNLTESIYPTNFVQRFLYSYTCGLVQKKDSITFEFRV